MDIHDIQQCPILTAQCLGVLCAFSMQDGCAIVINAVSAESLTLKVQELIVEFQGMKEVLNRLENRANNLR